MSDWLIAVCVLGFIVWEFLGLLLLRISELDLKLRGDFIMSLVLMVLGPLWWTCIIVDYVREEIQQIRGERNIRKSREKEARRIQEIADRKIPKEIT